MKFTAFIIFLLYKVFLKFRKAKLELLKDFKILITIKLSFYFKKYKDKL